MLEGQFYPRQGLQFINGYRAPIGLSVSYVTSVASTANVAAAGTYTFNGTSIGAADPLRLVVFALQAAATAAPAYTVTVNGNAATQLATAGTTQVVAFFAIAVAAGTTADFVVTVGANTSNNMAVSIWRVIGTTSAVAFDTASDTANDLAFSIDTAANGVVLMAARNAVTTATITWSGASEDYEAANGAEGVYTGASATTAAALNASYTGTWSDTSGGETGVAVSLSP